MKLGINEIDWGYIGDRLAQEDDNNQIMFFKSFVKECLSWGTKLQIERQLASVNLKLNKEEREVLSMIGYDE